MDIVEFAKHLWTNIPGDPASRQLSILNLRSDSPHHSEMNTREPFCPQPRHRPAGQGNSTVNITEPTAPTTRATPKFFKGRVKIAARTGNRDDVASTTPSSQPGCSGERKQLSARSNCKYGDRPDRMKCSYLNTLAKECCRILRPRAPCLRLAAARHLTSHILRCQAEASSSGRGNGNNSSAGE